MHIAKALLFLACLIFLTGCITQSRKPPPPTTISNAVPVGFDASVRIVKRCSLPFAALRWAGPLE